MRPNRSNDPPSVSSLLTLPWSPLVKHAPHLVQSQDRLGLVLAGPPLIYLRWLDPSAGRKYIWANVV